MPYAEYAPCARLTGVVECLWSLNSCGFERIPTSHWVLPDGCIDILFALTNTGQAASAELILVGPMTKARTVRLQHRPLTIGARFRPGGATSVLGIQARETLDQRIPLAEILSDGASELLDQLAMADGIRSRLSLLEDFLSRRVECACSMEPALVEVIKQLSDKSSTDRVEAIAGAQGFGARRIRRAFDRWVGLRPLLFCRIMRLRRLVATINQWPDRRWADRALEAGYYDQAHMNRDFKELVGVTPSDFLAAAD